MLGKEVKIPANEIDELDCQEADDGCQQDRAAPFRAISPELAGDSEVQSHDRQQKQGDDSQQLFGGRRSAGPVPAQSVPPERRSDLPTETARRVQQTSAAKGHESPLAGVALKRLCQAERL